MSSQPKDVADLDIFQSPQVIESEGLKEELIEQFMEMRAIIDAIEGDWLNNYNPNPTQWDAINCFERFLYLSGGNRMGKSWMLRFWAGWALSGEYPAHWSAPRQMGNINACFGSLNQERLYSNVSAWLFGDSKENLGKGFIPAHCLEMSNVVWDSKNKDMVRRAKVHRFDQHGHHMGFAHVKLWAYTEQFPHGDSFHMFGLDEEFTDKQGHWGSIIARLADVKGFLKVAATPEHGITEMYRDIKSKHRKQSHNHKMMYYGVHEADHITDKEEWINDFKGTREFALRVYGKPIAGAGAAFDVDFTELMLPVGSHVGSHFREIIGIDIPHVPQGIFAAVKIAWSEETQELVVLDTIEIQNKDYSHHVAQLRDMGGSVVPIAWPADSTNRVVHGVSFRDYMQSHGLNVLEQSAHEYRGNPDKPSAPGVQLRDIHPICQDLSRLMVSGNVKFLNTRSNGELVEQLQTFQFEENNKADKNQIDDIADAFFKAYMMRRFAMEARTTVSVGGETFIIDDEDWEV